MYPTAPFSSLSDFVSVSPHFNRQMAVTEADCEDNQLKLVCAVCMYRVDLEVLVVCVLYISE